MTYFTVSNELLAKLIQQINREMSPGLKAKLEGEWQVSGNPASPLDDEEQHDRQV